MAITLHTDDKIYHHKLDPASGAASNPPFVVMPITNAGNKRWIMCDVYGIIPGVTDVTATSPVVSSGGFTPAISMPAATASVDGHATKEQITKLDGIPTATAESDFMVAGATPFAWLKKTLAEVKTILGLGSAAYTASTAYDAAGTAAGKIASSISDGDTTHAPDGNSVFDALTLKQATGLSPLHSQATAENDVLVGAPTPFGSWVKKTIAEFKTILGLGSAAYTASTAYDVSGAAAGIIAASISDSDTTHCPDGNSVFDALAGKAATSQKLDDFGTPDDNTDLNANSINHGLIVKAVVPTTGLTNVVAIEYGETIYKNKALFDATVPVTQAFGDTAGVGTAVVAARRDHKHAMMSAPVISDATISTTDLTTNNATTSKHGFAPKAVDPDGGVLSPPGVNVVGIYYGDTGYTNKSLFGTAYPVDLEYGYSPGSVGSLKNAARVDHKHALPYPSTNPVKPAFLAYLSAIASHVTGDATVVTLICNTEVYDQANNYNNSTGKFTAPVMSNGYDFAVNVLLEGLVAAHALITVNLITTKRTYPGYDQTATIGGKTKSFTFLGVNMDLNDTAYISITVSGGSTVVDIYGDATIAYTTFSGRLSY
jgi:hypothetical protein